VSFGGKRGRRKARRSVGGEIRERRMVTVTHLAPPPSRARMWAFGYADLGELLGMTPAAVKKAVQRGHLDPGSIESVITFRRRRRPKAAAAGATAIVWRRVKGAWWRLGELVLGALRPDATGTRWSIQVAETKLDGHLGGRAVRRVTIDVFGPTIAPMRLRGRLMVNTFEGRLVSAPGRKR
jgi:hypothetical protein